ncbi:hypothetical protein [Oceanobacillus sp. Castelsardo]|uniref:hypothetical protein n=1 Tax=Oceanobacillus sp. Castelsardo TaxID=1851204 RepID=UPI0009EE7854|nr:hypothetical protein [Oceanobacillus sp. Castelsardo]
MGPPFIYRYLYIFYSIVFILNIFNVLTNNQLLNYIIGIFALVMLVISYFRTSRLFKILCSAFLVIGGIAYLSSDHSLVDLPKHMTSNISLLTLLSMLPWMNSVVKAGRFNRILNQLLQVKVTDLGKLYPRSTATTLTLASFLNLSAATISQKVLIQNLKGTNRRLRNSFINTSTIRGYSLALVWSPLEILVATSIFVTGVEYISVLPWLLLISVITFVLDAIWGRIHYRKHTYQSDVKDSIDMKKLLRNLVHLVIALALFLILVMIFGSIFALDFIFTVTILIFPFAAVWAILMKRWRSFWRIGLANWRDSTNNMHNFVVLFISLSLFEVGLNGTSILDVIQKPFLAFSEYPIIIFVLLQIIFIFLSMFGVHPIATIGILSTVITVLVETINPISLAIVMITSAIATLTVSTYGLLLQLTSMNIDENPYRITLINIPFALVFGGIGTIVAYLIL